MTRSYKFNDKNHSVEAAALPPPEPRMPKFHGKKHNHRYDKPKCVTKKGGGQGNWGLPGDDLMEEEADFNFNKSLRRTNSTLYVTDPIHFKTKFEVNEPESMPVVEEEPHGRLPEEDLSKLETSSSNGSSAAPDEVAR